MVEPSTNKDKPKAADDIDTFKNLLMQNFFMSSALISAFCYYLGWSVNSAYYVQLGFLPSLVSKSIPEILASAWIEIGLTCLGIIFLLFTYSVFSRYFHSKLETSRSTKKFVVLFFILLLPALLLGLYAFNYSWFIGPVPFIILISFVSLLLFWTASILGRQLELTCFRTSERKSHGLFKVIFPNFLIYLVFFLLASIYILNRAAIMRGDILAMDMMSSDKLPDVTIYSQQPLPIEGNFDASNQLFTYENMKLVDINDKYIFAFRRINHSPQTRTRIEKYYYYFIMTNFNSPRSTNIESYVIPRDQVFMYKVQ